MCLQTLRKELATIAKCPVNSLHFWKYVLGAKYVSWRRVQCSAEQEEKHIEQQNLTQIKNPQENNKNFVFIFFLFSFRCHLTLSVKHTFIIYPLNSLGYRSTRVQQSCSQVSAWYQSDNKICSWIVFKIQACWVSHCEVTEIS